jgi:hypothetical protein
MTEYWISQAKHWCDMCKCWMTDTPAARANHEKGSGHKINVQRKLREMRLTSEREKKEESQTQKELARIEKAAEQAYQKDLAQLVRPKVFLKASYHPNYVRKWIQCVLLTSLQSGNRLWPCCAVMRPFL